MRLRFGVGRPLPGDDPADWLLAEPGGADRRAIEDAMGRVCALLPELLDGELEKVMNAIHRRAPRPAAPEADGEAGPGPGT